MGAVTAVFTFLSTPAGQAVANQLATAGSGFVGLIGDLITLVASERRGGNEMGAVTAVFTFLSTPAGQAVANQLATARSGFVGLIGDLITLVHANRVQPTPPAAG